MKDKRFAWLEEINKNEWKFDFSKQKWNSDEKLDIAIENMGSKPNMSKSIFVKLIATYPYHFDAYHHLALVFGYEGKYEEALNLRKIGVEMGFSLFPKAFDLNKDKLEWSWLENRLFLRLMHGLAIDYAYLLKDTKKELEIYEQLLRFDPEDHQGCRNNAVGCYLDLGLTDNILTLAKTYGNDQVSPDVPFAEVLAYLSLGKKEEARSAIKHAINAFPYVAK